MISFVHLLEHLEGLDPFQVWIIERISMKDAPFGTIIKENKIWIDSESLDITTATSIDLLDWLLPRLGFSRQICVFQTWKDVKKQSQKQYYLRKALPALSRVAFMTIWILILKKVIPMNEIVFEQVIPLQLSSDAHEILKEFINVPSE